MPPKVKKSTSEKKKRGEESTDSVFDSSTSSISPNTCSQASELRKKSQRQSVQLQSKLSFNKPAMATTGDGGTDTETLEKLKKLIVECSSSLEKKIEEKTDFLRSAIFEIQQENASLKKLLEDSQTQMKEYKGEVNKLKDIVEEQREKINNLEQHSRIESIRVHGVKGDSKEENVEECEKKVLEIIHVQLGLKHINGSNISVLHRVGKFNETGKPRSIIVKFVSRKDKLEVMKERRKLKGTKVVVTEDLTQVNMQRLNRIKQHDNVINAWSAARGRLFAKLKSGAVREVVGGDTGSLQ